MSKNTCVLVLSVGRSGSSATAGMLHCLGVDMGIKYLDSDRNNVKGTFEDLGFVNLSRAILTNQADVSEFAGMVRDEPLWGVKDPQLCLTVGHFLPHLYEAGVDVRVVYVTRDRDDTIDSYNRAYYSGTEVAERWYDITSNALNANLDAYDGPLLELQWEQILENPVEAARSLADFIGTGHYNIHTAASRIAAKEKAEGWGSIALGVRISKFPEPDFFKSWTTLLTGGVESRDKVLMPVSHQPAHKAANRLADAFLKTSCDSLLLVDDDMTFAGNALNLLRYNEDNWDYDIVSALATTRTEPNKPIIMRLQDPQPEEPELLKGDSFDLVKEFDEGAVMWTDATGLAFTLIKRHVLEAMIDKKHGLDYTYFFTYGRGIESDDIEFCRKARALGISMAVDTSVRLGHVGQRIFTYEDYENWRDDRLFDANDLIPILEFAKQAGVNGQIGEKATKILGAISE